MSKKLKVIFAIFVLALIGQIFVQTIAAQCGNYFKTTYQAVNKPSYPNLIAPVRLDDWTGDGRLDYWALRTNTTTSTSDILIFPGLATGYWDWDNPIIYSTDIPMSSNTFGIIFYIEDYNSDGAKDLIYITQSDKKIFKNNNNGTFSGLQDFGDQASNIVIRGFIDVNSDGLLDMITVIAISQGISTIGYHLGMVNGRFDTRVGVFEFFKSTPQAVTLKLADFNGDSKQDIFYIGSGGPRLFVNQGNGNFTDSNQLSFNVSTQKLEIKDINSDGRADIVSILDTSRKLVVIYGQANGTLNVIERFLTTQIESPSLMRVAELNGNSDIDIIEVARNYYHIYLSDGSGGFLTNTYPRSLNSTRNGFPGDLVISQFSGDNKADVIEFYSGSTNMFGEPVVLVKENMCQPFGETKRANINGDQFVDLVTWNPNTGNWKSGLLQNAPGNIPSSIVTFNWGNGSLGDIPALGDFDGDGRTDYGVYRNGEGNWYVFLSSNSSWFVFQFGLPGDIPIPSDYDGGGKTDIAVFRPSDGNWYIWLTETQQFLALHFGANGDKPVPADYDGDGLTDIAVYRPSDGNWYYIKSSDLSYTVIHWGIATDKPVPADYDGDGKADLTVYRDGDWYILRSSNNSFNFIHLGNTTDVPMPIYRNADIAELMVYRASNAFWYIFEGNFTAGVSFGEAGQYPVYFGLPNN